LHLIKEEINKLGN
jgi:hypothetical protein